MILALSLRLVGSIYNYLHAYAPSNTLIRYLRGPEGRQWALAASTTLLAGYLAATAGLTAVIEAGGAEWLNLLVIICAWNAIKFFFVGLATLWGYVVSCFRRCLSRPPTRGLPVGGWRK